VSVLETIVARRRERVLAEYGGLDEADRERLAACAGAPRDLAAALRDRQDVAVIAEVKKASPSAGPIAPDRDASTQALHYQDGGAAAVSVLTEPEEFGGSFSDLSDVADAVDIPVLCKDFVVDPVQLFVARGHGADAVLLIVRVLGDLIPNYADLASTLGLTSVVEVADASELPRAWGSGAPVVAVNSRDLRTLKVDPDAQLDVIRRAGRSDALVIAASGIRTRADVERVAAAGAEGVLVGESLMRAPFPEDVLGELTGVPRRAPVSG
jgi:indole-3-glycerol phosphate synthase